MLSCQFCKIFKNSFFTECLRATASVRKSKILIFGSRTIASVEKWRPNLILALTLNQTLQANFPRRQLSGHFVYK